jgi:hypothetical protein
MASPRKKKLGRKRAQSRIVKQPISNWSDFVDIVLGWPGFRNWAFRGQADASWPLRSSLSRHVEYSGVCQDAWSLQEKRIRRIFERKSHLFLEDPPHDELEWLALMQHHGAPTRLLDLTWSPFVAAFFALERASGDAAVWAFNLPLMWQSAGRGLDVHIRDADPRRPRIYEKFYLPNKHAFVWQGDPFRMPQRVIAQSGTFLVSGHLGMTVEEIFEQYPRSGRARDDRGDALLVQFVFDTEAVRADAMASLYSMNITQSTLFPGLDGLARSMAYEFEYSWEVDLKTNELRETLTDGRVPRHILTID